MVKRARLVKSPGGLAPSGEGWFVVNTAKARWWGNERFGRTVGFEGKKRFPHFGINIHVLQPGQPNCMYHRESQQENFLVLQGTCLLLIEEKAIKLKAWDFVHCPPGTNHVFVGAGKGPCAILMAGARLPRETLFYPASPLALRHGAGVREGTPNPRVAYAESPRWKPKRAPWPPRRT